MENLQEITIEPKYKKENGLYVLDIDSVEVPFTIKQRQVVCIPAGQIGGNHTHPRREAFIGIGTELELVWQVGDTIHRTKMNPGGKSRLFVIPPYMPHAVINRAAEGEAVLLEYADDIQHDVEPCNLV